MHRTSSLMNDYLYRTRTNSIMVASSRQVMQRERETEEEKRVISMFIIKKKRELMFGMFITQSSEPIVINRR